MKVARYRSAARLRGSGGALALGLQAFTLRRLRSHPPSSSARRGRRPTRCSRFARASPVPTTIAVFRADEDDGTLASAGFGVDTSGRTPRTEYQAQGDLDWIKYPDDAFDTQAQGHFDGDVTFSIVPDTLKWYAQETFGQLVTDLFAIRTPDTIENEQFFDRARGAFRPRFDHGARSLRQLFERRLRDQPCSTTSRSAAGWSSATSSPRRASCR